MPPFPLPLIPPCPNYSLSPPLLVQFNICSSPLHVFYSLWWTGGWATGRSRSEGDKWEMGKSERMGNKWERITNGRGMRERGGERKREDK